MDNTEHFEVERLARRLFQAAPWVFFAFACLALAVPFLPADRHLRNASFDWGLATVVALFFGLLAGYSWRVVRALPFAAVSLDDQGLWQTALGRGASFVSWSAVARLRERRHLQRLELLGPRGECLMKLEYQLEGFPRLREIVLARSHLATVRGFPGQVFAKSHAYHVFNVTALVGFSLLGFIVWPLNAWAGAAVVLAVIGRGAREYLFEVHKVALGPDEILISSPLGKLTLRRADLVSIEVSDLITSQVRHPQVLLAHAKSSRPVVLRGLGASAVELKLALVSWLRNAT